MSPALTARTSISRSPATLIVKGERSEETKKKEKGYLYSERSYGSFQRAVQLPDEVECDKIAANYKDGVLELIIPKSEKSKPKQIKVSIKQHYALPLLSECLRQKSVHKKGVFR